MGFFDAEGFLIKVRHTKKGALFHPRFRGILVYFLVGSEYKSELWNL